MLMTETQTENMRRKVLTAARHMIGPGKYQADFEHGQWWVTRLADGAQWSVVDCMTQDRVDYLDLELVTRGEED